MVAKVLVTRPQHQAAGLIEALQSMGLQAICYPVLEIKPLDFDLQQIEELRLILSKADILISVSPNATRLVLKLINQQQFRLPESARIYAVGPGSARELGEQGYRVSTPECGSNSEALLELLALRVVAGNSVVLLCGQGGRNLLQEQLLQRGASVCRCEMYQRVAANQHQSLGSLPQPDVLTAMSGDTLDELSRRIEQEALSHWYEVPVVVPGERVAGIARQLGFRRVEMAADPGNESIMQSINRARTGFSNP